MDDRTAHAVRRFERAFAVIAATRMRGMPLLHPGLAVEAVGFLPCQDDDGRRAACGILVTPWFMNLIWLGLGGQALAAQGQVRERRIGDSYLEFIGADEASAGAYEMCSLFSPMFEFADQAAARATAVEVLALLRRPAPVPLSASLSAPSPAPLQGAALPGPAQAEPVQAGRRAFLRRPFASVRADGGR